MSDKDLGVPTNVKAPDFTVDIPKLMYVDIDPTRKQSIVMELFVTMLCIVIFITLMK